MAAAVDAQMRDSDAFSWYMEDDPLLRSTIVAFVILDQKPDWDRLMEREDRITRLLPGWRQRVVSPPFPFRLATPRWTLDPDFDLSWHMRRVEAPSPHDLSSVIDFCRTAGMTGFDRARPLWEFTVMEGLKGGQAALIMKIHHSLTDGVGGMQMALMLFDLQRDVIDLGGMPDAPRAGRLDAIALARDTVAFELRRLGDFAVRQVRGAVPAAIRAVREPQATAAGVLETARSVWRMVAPVSETLSPVMQERRLGWHYDVLDVPLNDLKRGAKAAGCTLNDAFLAGVTGGLRIYHERMGAAAPEELRMTLPISIRNEGDPMGGNRISLLRFKLPVGDGDVTHRMREIHRIVKDVRHEKALPYTNVVAAGLNLLPTSYVGGMLKHVDFLASDVPGFGFPVYLAGAEVLRYQAFGPTIGSSFNVTLLSYRDTCYVGITTDVGAVPDPGVLSECLEQGFDEVLALGGEHDSVGRPLEKHRAKPRRRASDGPRVAAGG